MDLYSQAHEKIKLKMKFREGIRLFLSLKIESQIKPTCEENMEGVRAVYAHVKPSGNCRMCHIDAICSYNESANAFRYFFFKMKFARSPLIKFALFI